MKVPGRYLWSSGSLLLLLVLGALSRMFYPWVYDGHVGANQTVMLAAETQCNPGGKACTAYGQDLTVTLELEDGVRPLKAFTVSVTLAGSRTKQVSQMAVRFTMVGMNMGVNRFTLGRVTNELWQGWAMLPVCSTGRQDWRTTVEVLADQLYAVTFPLQIAMK
jgi:hypothetical protein